ncbi:MAG: hypothetical protein FP816_19445 [Desulfobacteraceae bacterium]|nr:hypothetical protein [Desulfobacteraceae bacterium]MBU4000735.1 hypothetical protein [Pseudomonadota bacterium]MBU4053643.1 hypothetical protein [Pseudomonadota bacterium]
MSMDDVFKTRTMAGILTSQGQLKKAEEIITHLLEQNPHQPDLEVELDLLGMRMNPKNSNPRERLNELYRIWINAARKVL